MPRLEEVTDLMWFTPDMHTRTTRVKGFMSWRSAWTDVSENTADGAVNLTPALVFPYLHLPSSEFPFGMLRNDLGFCKWPEGQPAPCWWVQGWGAKAKNQFCSSLTCKSQLMLMALSQRREILSPKPLRWFCASWKSSWLDRGWLCICLRLSLRMMNERRPMDVSGNWCRWKFTEVLW